MTNTPKNKTSGKVLPGKTLIYTGNSFDVVKNEYIESFSVNNLEETITLHNQKPQQECYSLTFSNCPNLKHIVGYPNHRVCQQLYIVNCPHLTSIQGISVTDEIYLVDLKTPQHLFEKWCIWEDKHPHTPLIHLQNLPNITHIPKPNTCCETLFVNDCSNFNSLNNFSEITKTLTLSATAVKDIPPLTQTPANACNLLLNKNLTNIDNLLTDNTSCNIRLEEKLPNNKTQRNSYALPVLKEKIENLKKLQHHETLSQMIKHSPNTLFHNILCDNLQRP